MKKNSFISLFVKNIKKDLHDFGEFAGAVTVSVVLAVVPHLFLWTSNASVLSYIVRHTGLSAIIFFGIYFLQTLFTRKEIIEKERIKNEKRIEYMRNKAEELGILPEQVPQIDEIFHSFSTLKEKLIGNNGDHDIKKKMDAIIQNLSIAYSGVINEASERRQLIYETATCYLPDTIGNFLHLDKAERNDIVDESGKTAKQLVLNQLELLENKTFAIRQEISKQKWDTIKANGHFLEEKFAERETCFKTIKEVA